MVDHIHEKKNGQLETTCELDILPDTKLSLKIPDAYECIIVDSEKMRKKVKELLKGTELDIIVSPLPRGKFV